MNKYVKDAICSAPDTPKLSRVKSTNTGSDTIDDDSASCVQNRRRLRSSCCLIGPLRNEGAVEHVLCDLANRSPFVHRPLLDESHCLGFAETVRVDQNALGPIEKYSVAEPRV